MALKKGDKIGKLTAVKRHDQKKNGRVAWVCDCECGQTIVTEAYKLQRSNGKQKSCGCGQNTPGEESTYNSWKSMRDRCQVKSHHSYANYGGRGIKVYKHWRGADGYKNFLNDMGPKPEGHSLERIDTDCDYTPKNCVWADASAQAKSRRDRGDLMPTKMVRELISYFGHDMQDENVAETPLRVVKAWKGEVFAGYQQDPAKILTTEFKSGNYNQMVISKDIEIYSMCSHHMLPFFGKAHIAYLPDGKVCGLSKLARVADCFARRMQLQERLTQQICDALQEHLKPKGVMVVVEAQHMCMTMRGVGKQNSWMVTSAFKGAFEEHRVRQEFLKLIERKG